MALGFSLGFRTSVVRMLWIDGFGVSGLRMPGPFSAAYVIDRIVKQI